MKHTHPILIGLSLTLLNAPTLAQVQPYCMGCHTYQDQTIQQPLPLSPTPLEPLIPEARLDPNELLQANRTYAEKCAGCHGGYREGAIGRPLTPQALAKKSLNYIQSAITTGLPAGMPEFTGYLNDQEINRVAKLLYYPQLPPPPLTLNDMKATHELLIPPQDRPQTPQRKNWENTWGLVLRDVGQVAFLDGDTKERLTHLDLRAGGLGGFPHQMHISSNGRYFLIPGQDGNVWMVDLWTKRPQVVAQVRACWEARAAEFSKAPGYEDKYILVGCYTPNQLVILDGQTLEPLKILPTTNTRTDGTPLPRARLGYISGSKKYPVWIVQHKDAGQTWIVDYSRFDTPDRTLTITRLEVPGVPALHDGGWLRLNGPNDQRYAMVVSFPEGDQIVAIDVKEKRVAAIIPTGAKVLHAGRGVNFTHPTYGHVWGTTAASGEFIVIGADPEQPEYLWKIVARIKLPQGGDIYGKTHPNSPWILVDFAKNDNPEKSAQLCAIRKATLTLERCWEVPGAKKIRARLVQPEFNKNGTEIWVSAWTDRLTPGFIVIYDAATLQEKDRITGTWILSPLGKFNAYNTAHYIY